MVLKILRDFWSRGQPFVRQLAPITALLHKEVPSKPKPDLYAQAMRWARTNGMFKRSMNTHELRGPTPQTFACPFAHQLFTVFGDGKILANIHTQLESDPLLTSMLTRNLHRNLPPLTRPQKIHNFLTDHFSSWFSPTER